MIRLARLTIILSILAAILLPTPLAFADDSALFKACDANQKTSNSPICPAKGTKTNPVVRVIHVTADIFALLTGIAAVLLIIASGISMITSAGNAEAVGNARKRMLNALVGLVIVALAWVLVTFLTDKLIA